MSKITVTGKADLGFSPHFGCAINQGQEYSIEEADFTDQLFTSPDTSKSQEAPKSWESTEPK